MTTPIIVTACRRTCNACPSQWEGQTADGQRLYARYRWGMLEISLGPTLDAAVDADPLIDMQLGDEYDGYITDAMLRDVTRGLVQWPRQVA